MITSFTGTDLVYNILEAQLVGEIDGEAISSYAVSGGRAGSKVSDVVHPLLANNPYATGVKKASDKKKALPGGPIVMGRYSMKTHEKRPNMIRLIPDAANAMKKRDGFLIHGRGSQVGVRSCFLPVWQPTTVRLGQVSADRAFPSNTSRTRSLLSI